MKFLFVTDMMRAGGAQRQLVSLALAFIEDNHQVSFLTYHDADFYKSVLKENNINYTCIIESNYFKRLLKMRKFIRKGNYDVVVSFLEASNFICELAALPFKKWKLIVGERSANPNIFKSFKLRIYRLFHIFSNKVVANSVSNMKMVRKINPFLSDKKCSVIYNIVDLQKWFPDPTYSPPDLSSEFKIVVAASHTYVKNLLGLIEAINILPIQFKSRLKIYWYGDSITIPYLDNSYKEAIRKIESYNLNHIIKFFPATHNILKIYQKSDAVALFSHYEGLPNTICEAMACAKPIISSKVSDIPIIFNDSKYLFSPDSRQDILKAIINILETPPQQLKELGLLNRKRAEELFDKKNIRKDFYKILG